MAVNHDGCVFEHVWALHLQQFELDNKHALSLLYFSLQHNGTLDSVGVFAVLFPVPN